MSENYKIMSKFIKDLSGETPDFETYLYVKDFISKYQLNIEIISKALKAQVIEVDTILKFHDDSDSKKKSYFELTYTSIVKLNEEVKDKNIVQKIVLCDVQKEIFPEIEKALLNLLHISGYPDVKFLKKVDFEELYNKKFNYKKFYLKSVFKYCSCSFFSFSLGFITFLKYEIFVFKISFTPPFSLLKFNFGSF